MSDDLDVDVDSISVSDLLDDATELSAPATAQAHAASAESSALPSAPPNLPHTGSQSKSGAQFPSHLSSTTSAYTGIASSDAAHSASLRRFASMRSALPLLLSASTASMLIKNSDISELTRLSRRPRDSRAKPATTTNASTGISGGTGSGGSDDSGDSDRVQRPYFTDAESSSQSNSAATLLHGHKANNSSLVSLHSPLPVDSVARVLELIQGRLREYEGEHTHDFHSIIRQNAVRLFTQSQSTSNESDSDIDKAKTGDSVTSVTSEPSTLSLLLLSCLSTLSNSSLSSSSVSPLLSTFRGIMANQSPFGIRLAPSEQLYYDRIADLLLNAANSNINIAESLVRYWLGLGSFHQSLQTVNFLLQPQFQSQSLTESSTLFLRQWRERLTAMKNGLLRVHRSKHLTSLTSSARRVHLLPSSQSSSSRSSRSSLSADNRKKYHGNARKWDWEDDNGWDRFDDRVSAILEAAYQAGKSSVDFTIDGKPHTYRADFVRMVQRNLHTGREKPLRSLLALLIKEKNGTVTQTVEINMPHTTPIKELRRELATYLKHDEKLLRFMYGNRVLRRIDFNHISIRDAIVPLGAEPLTVTKMAKGDIEELCTFVLTGATAVKQESFECLTCDFVDDRVFCAICAQVCHKGHVVRTVTQLEPSFCHCGGGAGGFEAPCRALDEMPGDVEPPQPSHTALSSDSSFLYMLSPDMGLLKLGTGLNDTVTGKIYAQNTMMSAHAGGTLCAISDKLFLRSPLTGHNVLLSVDPQSLKLMKERIVLKSPTISNESDGGDDSALLFELMQSSTTGPVFNDSPLSTPSSSLSFAASLPSPLPDSTWTLEFCMKGDGELEDSDTAKDSGSGCAGGDDSTNASWLPVSPSLVARIKHALLSNADYGHTVSSLSSASFIDPLTESNSTSLSALSMAISIEEEGLFARIPTKLGMRKCKIRIKHREKILPVYQRGSQLIVVNLEKPNKYRQRHSETEWASPTQQSKPNVNEDGEEKKESSALTNTAIVTNSRFINVSERKKSRVPSLVLDAAADSVGNEDRSREREAKEKEQAERNDLNLMHRSTAAVANQRKHRRREHELVVHVYDLPKPMKVTSASRPVSLKYCARCGHYPALVDEQSAIQEMLSNESLLSSMLAVSSYSTANDALICPMCDAVIDHSVDDLNPIFELDESAQKQLEDMKAELERKSRSADDSRREDSQSAARRASQSSVLSSSTDSTSRRVSRSTASVDVENEEIEMSPTPSTASLSSLASSSSVTAATVMPNPSLLRRLLVLGFPHHTAERALIATNNATVDGAIHWMMQNQSHHRHSDEFATMTVSRSDGDGSLSPLRASGTHPVHRAIDALKIDMSVNRPNTAESPLMAIGDESSSSFFSIGYSVCEHRSSMPLGVIVDTYKRIIPKSSLPQSANLRATAVCDGCGASAASSPSLSFSLCLDRDCKDYNVFLCQFCELMGNYHAKSHHHHHSLERVQFAPDSAASDSEDGSLRLTLGEFHLYCDTDRLALIVMQNSTSASGTAASKRQSAAVLDYSTVFDNRRRDVNDVHCLARDIHVKTKGDTFVYDTHTRSVWALSLASGRLERWQCPPLIRGTEPTTQQRVTMTGSDAAQLILQNLLCLASSTASIAAIMNSVVTALQSIHASSELKHSQLMLDALQLMHSCFARLNQQGWTAAVSKVAEAQLNFTDVEQSQQQSSPTQSNSVNLYVVIQRVRLFLEQQILALPRLPSLSFSAHSSLQAARTCDAALLSQSSSFADRIAQAACDIIVEAFELFYGSWKSRLHRTHSLMLAAPSQPRAKLILSLLGQRWKRQFLGLDLSTSSWHASDLSLISVFVRHHMSVLIDGIYEVDRDNIAASVTGGRDASGLTVGGRLRNQHFGTFLLMSYQAQLAQAVERTAQSLTATVTQQPRASNDSLDPIRARVAAVSGFAQSSAAANTACVQTCRDVFNKCAMLIQSYDEQQRQLIEQQPMPSVEPEAQRLANAAESTLMAFSQSSLGLSLPWFILLLSSVQCQRVHHRDINALLSSILALMCKLSSLTNTALSSNRTCVEENFSAVRTNVRLSDTRAKIAQLRQAQLLIDPDLAPSQSLPVSKLKRGRHVSVIRLHPFALQVFTAIFYEFVSPSSWLSSGVPAMNKQDFILYLKRRSSTNTEQAVSKAVTVFNKYGVSPLCSHDPTLSSATIVDVRHVGDESSHLLLEGFLAFVSDTAVENPKKVLKELRFLEYRHSFNNTHHQSLTTLNDLKVAFATLLHQLFVAPVKKPASDSQSQSGASVYSLNSGNSVARALLSRSLEDQVNVKPGEPTPTVIDRADGANANNSNEPRTEIDSAAVMKLMNSQERWQTQQRRKEKIVFLQAFIQARPINIPSHFASSSSLSLLNLGTNNATASESFDDSHSAARLSELFQRCMREMGSGYGHASLSSGIDAFVAEKSFAAALLKHNELVDACLVFARSLDLWRLLASAATKGTRCLSQPSCPEWWRLVIKATMEHVRMPIAAIIREIRERADEQAKAEQAETTRKLVESEITARSDETSGSRTSVPYSSSPSSSSSPSPSLSSTLTISVSRRDVANSPDDLVLDSIHVDTRARERMEQANKASADTRSRSPHSDSLSHSLEIDSSALSVDSPLNLAQSPVLSASLGGLSLEDDELRMEELDPAVKLVLSAITSNAMFLLHDLRPPATATAKSSRVTSRVGSPKHSRAASTVTSPKNSRSSASPIGWTRVLSQPLAHEVEPPLTSAPEITIEFDASQSSTMDEDLINDDGDDEADDEAMDKAHDTHSNSLSLHRAHSDRFGSPMRGAASPRHPPALLSAGSPSPHGRVSLSPPPLLTSGYGRRLSESDAPATVTDIDIGEEGRQFRIASQFASTTSVLPVITPHHQHTTSFSMREATPLSSWTGSSLDPALLVTGSSAAAHFNALDTASLAPPLSSFESDWIATLVHAPMPLTLALSSSIHSLQTALLSRVHLLCELNSCFRSGQTRELVDDVLSLVHSSDLISDIQTSSSLRARSQSTEDALLFFYKHLGQTLSKQRFQHSDRDSWTRLRTILLFFSVEFQHQDSDLILGSGMLSVLARFVQRADRALHPIVDDATNTSTGSEFAADERTMIFKFKSWAWQIFLYLSTLLLATPNSAKSKHQRYVLASTVGQQLTIMLKDHVSRLLKHAKTGDWALANDDSLSSSYDFSARAKIHPRDLFDSFTYPMQRHNPLFELSGAVDELVFRSVDMMQLLTQIAQQHSVCSSEHLLFMMRSLRSPSQSQPTFCPLPSLVQLWLVRLMRAELPYHSPHLLQSSSLTAQFAALSMNQPQSQATDLGQELLLSLQSQLLESQLVNASVKTSKSNQRERVMQEKQREQKEPQSQARGLRRERPSTSVLETGRAVERSEGKESSAHTATPPRGARAGASSSASLALRSLTQPFELSPSMTPATASTTTNTATTGTSTTTSTSTRDAPNSPKDAKKTSHFRRVAVLLCRRCRYIEFPACPYHRCYLTKEQQVQFPNDRRQAIAACSEADCPVSTLNSGGASWQQCIHCAYPRPSLRFWNISDVEAVYAADAIKSNQSRVIEHNVFLCSKCNVCEFPGTKSGGLTMNIQGFLYDIPTRRFLQPSHYQFTHLPNMAGTGAAGNCNGEIQLIGVKLSKDEADYLGKLVKRTQPTETNKVSAVEVIDSASLTGSSNQRHAVQPERFDATSHLCEPWAFTSWQPSPLGRHTVLDELIDMCRSLLQSNKEKRISSSIVDSNGSVAGSAAFAMLPASSPSPIGHSSSFSVSARTSPSHSRVNSMTYNPRLQHSNQASVPIKQQWRENLSARIRSSLLLTSQVCEALIDMKCRESTLQSMTAPVIPAYLASLSALLVLGGHDYQLHVRQRVTFTASDIVMYGVVTRYDPSVATVSVAVNAGQSQSPDADNTAPVSPVIQASETIELPVDAVSCMGEFPPPSLASLGMTDHAIHVAQKSLAVTSVTDQASVNHFLVTRLQLSLVRLLTSQSSSIMNASSNNSITALNQSSSTAAVAPFYSLIPTLLQLSQSVFGDYSLMPLQHQLTVAAMRDHLQSRLIAKLDPAHSHHAAVFAALQPPQSGDENDRSKIADNTRNASGSMAEKSAPTPAAASSPSPIISLRVDDDLPPPQPLILIHLDRLIQMGFSHIAAKHALAAARGDLQAATNAILTEPIYEDGELDENQAQERWEALIDRLNCRDAVEAYLNYQIERAQSASESHANANTAPNTSNNSGTNTATDRRTSELDSDREKRALQAAPSVFMAHRFLWPGEEPETPDPQSLPVNAHPAPTVPLNFAPTPHYRDVNYDKNELLYRLLTNSLLDQWVEITEEACSVYSAPTNDKKRGYKVGDRIFIVDLVHKVCPAEVVEVNASSTKIYIHYSGWSKKWDEWVECDSKRIQPNYKAGDKLIVLDSVNKESECQVVDVGVKENQLKLLVHYIGWTTKWDEWIAVNSKRVIQKLLPTSPANSRGLEWKKEWMRPTRSQFELIGAQGKIVKIDALRSSLGPYIGNESKIEAVSQSSASGLALTEDDSPFVLVKITDHNLELTQYLWMKLALLKLPSSRAHQHPHRYPVLGRSHHEQSIVAASVALSGKDLNGAIGTVSDWQQRLTKKQAIVLLQLFVRQELLVATLTPPTNIGTSSNGSGSESIKRRLSFTSLASQPRVSLPLPHVTNALKLLAAYSATHLHSMLEFATPKSSHSVTSINKQLEAERSILQVTETSAQHSIDAQFDSLANIVTSLIGHDPAMFDQCSSELTGLINEFAVPNNKLMLALRSFTVSSLSPPASHTATSATLTVQCDSSDVSLQLVSMVPMSDAEMKADRINAPLWRLTFWSDAKCTVKLSELILSNDPNTRLHPPFLVTNPVYVTARTIKGAKTRAKSKSDGTASGGGEPTCQFAVTPFTTHSCETLFAVSELLVRVRRAYRPSQRPLASATVSTVKRLESLLKQCYQALSDLAQRIHRALPVPSNIKVRAYEQLAKILSCLTFSHVEMNAAIKKSRECYSDGPGVLTAVSASASGGSTWSKEARKLSLIGMEERKEVDEGDSASTVRHRHQIVGHTDRITATHPHASHDSPTHTRPPPSPATATTSTMPSYQTELLDLNWLVKTVLSECKTRYSREKPSSPLYSVYLQRCVELFLTGLRFEKLVINHKFWEMKHSRTSGGPAKRASDGPVIETLRNAATNEFTAVLAIDRLLLLTTDIRAHPPLSSTSASMDSKDCDCSWCQAVEEAREQTAMAMPLIDFAPTSVIHTLVRDMDTINDSVIVGNQQTSANIGPSETTPAQPPMLIAAATAIAGTLSSSFSSIFASQSPSTTISGGLHSPSASPLASPASAPASLPSAAVSSRSRSEEKVSPILSSSNSSHNQQSDAISLARSSEWRVTTPLAERLLPNASLRAKIFNLLLNSTAVVNHSRPELAFRRGSDHSGDDSSSGATSEDSTLQRHSMFAQLCDAFVKGKFHSQAAALRAEVNTVTWKTILAGALDQGAAGLPGPFRQAIFEICQSLNEDAHSNDPARAHSALLIPNPNSLSQTGDDRHKLMLNPGLFTETSLVQCRIFGQLLGIAIRSKCCLDLDLSEVTWKLLLKQPLKEEELLTFDYTAFKSLMLADPISEVPFTADEFDEYLAGLPWTTMASDQRTRLELLPSYFHQQYNHSHSHSHGQHRQLAVSFKDRWLYRRLAIHRRLTECCLQIEQVRLGLYSVIPAQSLDLLSWQELELRVCGRATVDLDLLKRHTVYSPSTYTLHSPVVQMFWQVMTSFSQAEIASFLQFAWARSRLPSEMGSYRMQINIIDNAHTEALPTAETCFFNVNLPRYRDIDTMTAKIRVALLCGTITS